MDNTLTSAELKRRGLAAIEDGLRTGPVLLLKRNKPTAVVLSQDDYQQLISNRASSRPGLTAMQWLLTQPGRATRDKASIDSSLQEERNW